MHRVILRFLGRPFCLPKSVHIAKHSEYDTMLDRVKVQAGVESKQDYWTRVVFALKPTQLDEHDEGQRQELTEVKYLQSVYVLSRDGSTKYASKTSLSNLGCEAEKLWQKEDGGLARRAYY